MVQLERFFFKFFFDRPRRSILLIMIPIFMGASGQYSKYQVSVQLWRIYLAGLLAPTTVRGFIRTSLLAARDGFLLASVSRTAEVLTALFLCRALPGLQREADRVR